MRTKLKVSDINYWNIGRIKYSIYRWPKFVSYKHELKINFSRMEYKSVFKTYFLTMYMMDLPVVNFMSSEYFITTYYTFEGIKSTYLDTFEIEAYYDPNIDKTCVDNSITNSFCI